MCAPALFQLRVHNCSLGFLREYNAEQVEYFSLEKKKRNAVDYLKKKKTTIPTCNFVTCEGIALWIKERAESAHWPGLHNYDDLKDNQASVYLIVCCHSHWEMCQFHEWLYSSHWQFVYGQVFTVLPKNSDQKLLTTQTSGLFC